MAKRRKTQRLIVLILLVALSAWLGKNGKLPRAAEDSVPVADSLEQYTQPVAQSSAYELLEDCTLLERRSNDGDSFWVKHAQGETEFRLYYADAPESQFREYAGGDTNGKRIAEQGAYFGGLNRERTTAVGMEAKTLVKKLLSHGRFHVLTRWENVYGPQRKYAFVIVEYQGKPVYLHELLVRHGLARIHTRGAALPNGRSVKEQKANLRTLEAAAKQSAVGAWRH